VNAVRSERGEETTLRLAGLIDSIATARWPSLIIGLLAKVRENGL
jgi:hypothetical protein